MAPLPQLQFWLSFNNGKEKFMLPVNPPSVEFSSSRGYEDVEVNQLGEYTIIGGARLKGVSFSSFFPRDYNPSFCALTQERMKKPWDYIKAIERWKDSGEPCRLIITNTPINMAVTIRDFTYSEEGGAVGDLMFSLSLKEFKFIKIREIGGNKTTKPKVSNSAKQRPNTQAKSSTYKVKSGDNLSRIASANGTTWQKLSTLNKIKSPYTIHPGQVIKLS